MKRLLIMILAMVVVSTSLYAANDEPSSWAKDVVTEIFAEKLLDERMQGDYQTEISRRDFAYLGVVLYENITGKESEVGDAQFPDSDDIYVLKAKNIGVVKGYEDGSFRPDQKINRQELAVLFINTLVATNQSLEIEDREIFFDDEDIAGWAKKSVYTARAFGIVKGVGENLYDPLGTATREQSMLMFKRMFDKYAGAATIAKPEPTTETSAQTEKPETTQNTTQSQILPPTTTASQPEPLPQIDAIDFTANTLSGEQINLADYSDKPVVMIFFTSQCQPCLDQLLTIKQSDQENSSDYHYIAINLTKLDNQSDLERLVKRYDIDYDIVLDKGELTEAYKIKALPTTVLVDDGALKNYFIGTMTLDYFEQFISSNQ